MIRRWEVTVTVKGKCIYYTADAVTANDAVNMVRKQHPKGMIVAIPSR